MGILHSLLERAHDPSRPFLLSRGGGLSLRDVAGAVPADISLVNPGEVVALIGGFDPQSIASFLFLLDRGNIVIPLAKESRAQHASFFKAAHASVVIEDGRVERLPRPEDLPLLKQLRDRGEAGIVFFSSGTTGEPKAILHAASRFLTRYHTPRKPMRTLAFLLFDHIGGINTLLHMLFNEGEVVVPGARDLETVVTDLRDFKAELLPATPTFLRLMLLHGLMEQGKLPDLKLVTYGTERMDQPTLDAVCEALPATDFRQTYGMSELGILRIKSKARDSLWMRVGGEGVAWEEREGILYIRAEHRMLGYLNAPQPFEEGGWYCTQDRVETDGVWLRITGRQNDLINVAGQKVMPGEVEAAALRFPGVIFAKAFAKPNPITGMHVEMECQFEASSKMDPQALKTHLRHALPQYAVPLRIVQRDAVISARFKRR